MNPVSFFFFLRFFFFNVDHVLKVFIEFLTVLLLFYALVFGPWSMWNLSSPTWDGIHTPSLVRLSLNHWKTRDIPTLSVSMNPVSLLRLPSGPPFGFISLGFCCFLPVVERALLIPARMGCFIRAALSGTLRWPEGEILHFWEARFIIRWSDSSWGDKEMLVL